MSDEEKKAIEVLNYIKNKTPFIFWYEDKPYNRKETINTVLNLIEKQFKEIEELKDKNFKIEDEKTAEIINLKNEIDTLNGAIENYQEALNLHNKKWEDKIKAKIEEIDKEIKVKREIAKNPMDRVSGRLLTDSIVELEKAKRVLQSLLEKE